MLVASGAELTDEAVAIPPHQIIGIVQTAIGRATLTRDGSAATQISVGDPVSHGDMIETAADGQIGILLVDGTVFNVANGARIKLNEYVCDPNGAVRSIMLAVTRGSFSFAAGRLGDGGTLTVDTPMGSIRGRSCSSGFGILTLAALTFSMMPDANAADPDATFLDDDKIDYKDLQHGSVELITKEAVPRHIIVDDPGQTIVLNRIGSSVNMSQFANSAARMEELQAAQHDVLANLTRGPTGSSTPPFGDSLSIQHINFTSDTSTAPPNLLPPLLPFDFPVVTIIRPPPLLGVPAGPIEVDTIHFDQFNATSGTFTASSPEAGAVLTFGLDGGTSGNTILGGKTYDVSSTSPYGTLYLNSTTGAYTFVPNSDAINALKAPTTTSFTVTVSDGNLSVSQAFTVTLNGVEDAAIISGTTAGSVIAPEGVVDASPGTLTATGKLTDTDPDDPPNTFTAISSPATSKYGTFTMTTAGVWTYTLDRANGQVQALHVGDILTDGFTVTSIDGTPRSVTITIHGPLVGTTGTAPTLTLSETHLTATSLDDNLAGSAPDATLTTTSGNFSTAFTSVQGTDGATISYALSITGGNGTASGLIDSHSGEADVLILNGNTVEGHVGTTGGALAFSITLDPTTGIVTFTEYRAVRQPSPTNPDGGEGASLTAGIVNLMATVTEANGAFQTASRDLGSQLTITDDGPTIAATGTVPSLSLSETHLAATALDDNIAGSAPDATLTTTSGDFSTAFTSIQGADGATISYALSIAGGNGTASGLIDSHTGRADVLVLNGSTIEGHVGSASGALAFIIALDPTTGLVTFTDFRAVSQPFGANPDSGEGASLTAGIVNLTATIVDRDGDFQTASLDLGSRLTITDDGPTIGGFDRATVLAKDGQVANGTFSVNFGADGESAMQVAIHDGAVNGFNLATTDLGGGITSVHVTGNGDDYTFYYATHAASGGVELDAFFTDAGGTLSDPFFTLLVNPDGTYTFDVEGVGFLRQTTVNGSDFGASGSGQPSLTAPDGLLVITGDFNGAPADVKASSNGIAVGDTGLQMDHNETLLLTFKPEQTDVSFNLTQWQGNGTADVVFKVFDGATEVHDFNINIPKPSGDAHIVVEQTSNPALVDTYAFDGATSTYTLYVGSEFNQIGVSYDHAAAGNATFTVNNITYSEGPRIPSTDLLFDVTAIDRDGDTSTTSLQADLVGTTGGASAPSSATSQPAIATISATSAANPLNTATAASSPTRSDSGYSTFTMTAAGVWTYTLDNNNFKAEALDVGHTPTDHFTLTAIDGSITDVVSINSQSTGDAADSVAASPAVVTSDPPKVDETHQGETIAGRGDADQIIDAGAGKDTVAGKSDLLHAGSRSGAIQGGSATGTTDSNHGNDAVIGGHGADHPNGNDRYANLFTSDPNAARFEAVADHHSDPDKIGLTALGALGFVILALDSASTSVPAHTIAWLYDSSANETIVYVNPTDQPLQIGDSSLMEIHLQGIASIEPSDFIAAPAAATTDAVDPTAAAQGDTTVIATGTSSVSTDTSAETLSVDRIAATQAADVSHSLDAGQSGTERSEHPGSPDLDGTATPGLVEMASASPLADFKFVFEQTGKNDGDHSQSTGPVGTATDNHPDVSFVTPDSFVFATDLHTSDGTPAEAPGHASATDTVGTLDPSPSNGPGTGGNGHSNSPQANGHGHVEAEETGALDTPHSKAHDAPGSEANLHAADNSFKFLNPGHEKSGITGVDDLPLPLDEHGHAADAKGHGDAAPTIEASHTDNGAHNGHVDHPVQHDLIV